MEDIEARRILQEHKIDITMDHRSVVEIARAVLTYGTPVEQTAVTEETQTTNDDENPSFWHV